MDLKSKVEASKLKIIGGFVTDTAKQYGLFRKGGFDRTVSDDSWGRYVGSSRVFEVQLEIWRGRIFVVLSLTSLEGRPKLIQRVELNRLCDIEGHVRNLFATQRAEQTACA